MHDMTTAVRLIWQAAGRPERTHVTPWSGGVCWWCAEPWSGQGMALSKLSSSFPWQRYAAAKDEPELCLPCAWSLGIGFDLSPESNARLVLNKARRGPPTNSLTVIEDGQAVKRRVTLDDDGLVELRDMRGTLLRTLPVDKVRVGPQRFLASFHHFYAAGRWMARTDTDRDWIREHLLREDLEGPCVAALALEQGKHTLIRAEVEHPETGSRAVYASGRTVRYQPAELAQVLHAVEGLRLAMISAEEIEVGRYQPRGLPALRALRACEPVLAPVRNSRPGLLGLAVYLRRRREDIPVAEHPWLTAETPTPGAAP